MTCRYCENPAIGQEIDHSDGYRFPVCAMCAHVNRTVHLNDGGTIRFGTFRVGMPAFMVRMSDPSDPYNGAVVLGSAEIVEFGWSSTFGHRRALVRYHSAGVSRIVSAVDGEERELPGTEVWVSLPDLDRARRQAHR